MKKIIQLLFMALSLCAFETESLADSYILEPGETYVLRMYKSKGDLFGISSSSPEYHSFEITIFRDGTASGVYKVGKNDYDEDDAYKVNLTGSWGNVSKYDKKVVEIRLSYNGNGQHLSYTIYVDNSLKAYLDDMNNSPGQLYKKEIIISDKSGEERKEELKKDFDRLQDRLEVPYEVVDLGLSVKWANLNGNRLGKTHRGLLDYPGFCSVYDKKYNKITYTGFNMSGGGVVERYDFKVDRIIDYIAGGKHHGEPVPLTEDEYSDYKSSFLLEELGPNPHIPTKAEWQELIDNCTIDIETSPLYSHPYAAYWDDGCWYKMLRLTSKINGKSIVIPFNEKRGTNYATSQYLSDNPNMATCVHVDSSGLSFVENHRQNLRTIRFVFGEINMEVLQDDIQMARAAAEKSPAAYDNIRWMQNQEVLEKLYENRLMRGVITIEAPSIIVKDVRVGDDKRELSLVIKAPIYNSGEITPDSNVGVFVDGFDNLRKAKIVKIEGNKIYVEYNTPYLNPDQEHFIVLVSYNNPCTKKQMVSLLTSDTGEHIYGKGNEEDLDGRFIATPRTYFRINKDNTVCYIKGPQPPCPQLTVPAILNVGTPKGKKTISFKDVEAGFDIKELNWPIEHPIAQSFNLTIQGREKEKIKVVYNGLSGDTHKYTIKSLDAGIPYLFVASAKDQYGGYYESSITITLNTDGSTTIEERKE